MTDIGPNHQKLPPSSDSSVETSNYEQAKFFSDKSNAGHWGRQSYEIQKLYRAGFQEYKCTVNIDEAIS